MDLESECSGSVLESVEDNDEVVPETESSPPVDEISSKVENNDGYCGNQIQSSSFAQNVDSKSLAEDLKAKQEVQPANPVVYSPPSRTRSPSVPGGSPPPVTKGYGLKKWRRIKRDPIRDSSTNIDNSKILKRASSSSANPARPHRSVEANQMSEGSVGSVNMLVRNSVVDDYLGPRALVGSGFAIGMNSEDNSDDHSSKSSTAASAPKSRHDLPAVLGNARERNKMKSSSGKVVGNSVLKVHQVKGKIETSKKPRGERAKIEKENSHSSMESDSRSSNFVFQQGASSSVTSNGKQVGKSTNHEIGDSDEGRMSELKFNEGQVDHSQDDLPDGSSSLGEEGRSQNHQSSTNEDPLAESLVMLQSVQEALENEVKKFREIGRESISSSDAFCNGSSSAPNFLERQALSLKERVSFLENKLEETSVTLKEKESKVAELEAALHSFNSQMGESSTTSDLQPEKRKEMESEVEALFKQKIEAEIEYVSITQKLRVATEDQKAVVEEQRALTMQQSELLTELKEAKSKIAVLKKRAEDWEVTYSEDVLGTAEVVRMEKRVCRVTSCFFIQLILLVLVFGLLILQLQPHPSVVVPT